ncbi:NADPH-adrenodoxin reductase [Tulasnella sp. 403]|nr:NADPH-adrenodoxin reductase [Tulasnella sp. 403]
MTKGVLPVKLAVIGAGPSAFYAASRILSSVEPETALGKQMRVHMYDRSWAPHGLVRYGVAPDHPEVKNCIHKFDLTAEDPRFRYYGNVSVSSQASQSGTAVNLKLQDLFPHYTHLLLAIGSSSPQPLPKAMKSTPAIDVVHWYTGHESNPPAPPLEKTKHLTLIGHGNVSLDIARLLLTPPSVLARLDIPERVLEVLRRSQVEEVEIVSRRGPAEVSFTAKELRELLQLPNATLKPIPATLLETPKGATRQQSRILELLRKGSVAKGEVAPDARHARWSLEFFRSPIATRPGEITYELNELDEQRRARGTGKIESRKTDLVISSVGSRTTPLVTNVSGTGASTDPWFDAALGRIRNTEGRVVDGSVNEVVRNVYTSGWASHGAKGVLAATMYDAYSVADRLLADHVGGTSEAGTSPMNACPDSLESVPEPVTKGLGEKRVITWDTWKQIEREEKRRGLVKGKENERMTWGQVQDFLSTL